FKITKYFSRARRWPARVYDVKHMWTWTYILNLVAKFCQPGYLCSGLLLCMIYLEIYIKADVAMLIRCIAMMAYSYKYKRRVEDGIIDEASDKIRESFIRDLIIIRESLISDTMTICDQDMILD